LTRGISDPAPIPESNEMSDLPSMAEVDQALQQLFAEIDLLRAENRTLKDILGAAIATNTRLTGL
jgi:hypothetical protein